MNSETLGLLFTITQIGIFSTRLKAFETEFTAKTSLRTFLTIYMALSQRLTQVGKDPYLLELLKLHQIGAHALPLPRRATLFLAPSRTDGPNCRKSRENELSFSRNHKIPATTSLSSFCPFFALFHLRRQLFMFCLIQLTIHLIPIMSLVLDF